MPRRRSTLMCLILFSTLCAGCEGAAGATGPTGPTGPAGTPGPGTRVVLSATVASNGTATVTLPAAAGTMQNPPALTCYIGPQGATSYLVVGTDLSGPTCGLVASGGSLAARVIGAVPGWAALFAVVY